MPVGNRDQLSESLRADDDARGSEATTVTTHHPILSAPRKVNSTQTVEFDQTARAMQLVNQSTLNSRKGIIYWSLNTFFPTLQLFFESGLSSTIDGSQLPSAIVGLDTELRFRLTDCIYEEEGSVKRSMLPAKFRRSGINIEILEATIAQRTSIAVKSTVTSKPLESRKASDTAVMYEDHTVIGLRLSGMDKMSYIWAKAEAPSKVDERRVWGDVRLTDLRKDVPAPSLGLAADVPGSGGELAVVERGSRISTGAQVIVLYPRKDGAKFDLDYYHATHMPLAKKNWSSLGLKSFSVTQLSPDNQYSIASILEFDSQESIGKAMADPSTKEIMDDVPNFSSETPVIVAGNITLRG
ncbi:hypothetical protein N0V94_003893 [Neodidymelliopsis sp. IMI 364377]|nr:hypothetical protein N0V94_003893 [Neodidymelliopsis sp. IMI 364377]